MAASLKQVRNAIKATLDAALGGTKGLSCYAIEPASPKYPAAWTYPIRINYHADADGDSTYTLAVTVGVAATEMSHAQTNLDPYLAPAGLGQESAKSIVAALETDPSLGGVVDSVKVNAMTNYSQREIAGGSAILAQFEVEVFA